jgi:hypothetical protein
VKKEKGYAGRCFKAIRFFGVIVVFFFNFNVWAQYEGSNSNTASGQDTSRPHEEKQIPQKDLGDIARQLFHRKATPWKDSMLIIKPVFSALPAAGYTLTTRFAVTLSGNCAFRTSERSKLSTIIASAAYTQNKQFTVPFQSSIWTANNKYNLLGDYRLYKYPQSTFGLGSSSWIKNEIAMDYSYFRFYEVLLRHIVGNFYAGAGYITDVHWNITEIGLQNHPSSDYDYYGPQSRSVSSGVTFNALYDNRDNLINPSKGSYTSLQYRDNLHAFGSTSGWSSLIADLRKYYLFPRKSSNILAFWSYNWLVIKGRPPYFDLPSTSWDQYSSTGAGYIQGRFRGAQMVYLEAQYRFKITRNGLFGGVIFLNGQSFSAAPGSSLQRFQPGWGPGLRIKLNKLSKTNISIDYGFGTQGSKGLFINIGELF